MAEDGNETIPFQNCGPSFRKQTNKLSETAQLFISETRPVLSETPRCFQKLPRNHFTNSIRPFQPLGPSHSVPNKDAPHTHPLSLNTPCIIIRSRQSNHEESRLSGLTEWFEKTAYPKQQLFPTLEIRMNSCVCIWRMNQASGFQMPGSNEYHIIFNL